MTILGWVEGRDYVIDARYTNGIAQAAPGLAAELVSTQPDLLLTTGELAVRVLAQRTNPAASVLEQQQLLLPQRGGNEAETCIKTRGTLIYRGDSRLSMRRSRSAMMRIRCRAKLGVCCTKN